jgi:hypothetical protein
MAANPLEVMMKPYPVLVAAFFTAAAFAMPPTPGATLKGEVLEVQSVEAYTYLRLKTQEGEIWSAVPKATVVKGQQVELVDATVMENFESKTLKRTFNRIYFAQLLDLNARPTAASGNPHGASLPTGAPVAKVAKATGSNAKTVAEVVSGRTALKDKSVTIRAQVVKVNAGIMGKNWIHLQDGSGVASAGTHDILVTTADTIAVGDVVNASGTVRTDVKVGPGYAYAVLVEDAKLRK